MGEAPHYREESLAVSRPRTFDGAGDGDDPAGAQAAELNLHYDRRQWVSTTA